MINKPPPEPEPTEGHKLEQQADLFDVGERLTPTASQKRKSNPCTPFAPGTGPKGETCGSCQFKGYQSGTGGRYLKCLLMYQAWTRGGATDIRARWSACYAWKAKDPDKPRQPDWRSEMDAYLEQIHKQVAERIKASHDAKTLDA